MNKNDSVKCCVVLGKTAPSSVCNKKSFLLYVGLNEYRSTSLLQSDLKKVKFVCGNSFKISIGGLSVIIGYIMCCTWGRGFMTAPMHSQNSLRHKESALYYGMYGTYVPT